MRAAHSFSFGQRPQVRDEEIAMVLHGQVLHFQGGRGAGAGESMELLRQLYTGLQFRINETKSAVDLASRRKILGYSFWFGREGSVKRRVASKAIATMKENVRLLTKLTGGRSMSQVRARLGSYLRGWKEYFRLAETPRILADLDEWIRHWETQRSARLATAGGRPDLPLAPILANDEFEQR
jgi:hypothetical protein